MVAVLCAILGAVVGIRVSDAVARRHQHQRAVMSLLAFHAHGMDGAVQAHACANLGAELDSLRHLQRELLLAFPVPYAQDAQFRARADGLASALQKASALQGAARNTDCRITPNQLQPIGTACEDCHHQFD